MFYFSGKINNNKYLVMGKMIDYRPATVVNVQGNGHFDNEHGRFFCFDYRLKDNQSGKEFSIRANHKKAESLSGVVEYLINSTNGTNGHKGKVRTPKAQAGGGRPFQGRKNNAEDPRKQVLIVAQSSMSKAVDIVLSGAVEVENGSVSELLDQIEDVCGDLMDRQLKLTSEYLNKFKSI